LLPSIGRGSLRPGAEWLGAAQRKVGLNYGVNPLTCSLALIVSAALGGSGDARPLPVTIQDDTIMLHRSPAYVRSTARRMARVGADRLRLTAGWSVLAPDPTARKMPQFNAADPDQYPAEPWSRLDRAVKAATSAGLDVQIDVAFMAPRWAVERKRKARRGRYRWNPDPELFGKFSEAVARRYSGRHTDPARPGRRLPAVRLWTTWNEPNHPTFLLPQWERQGGRWVPHSPHIYREMHEQGYAAIKRINEENQVLIGGTAGVGSEIRAGNHAIAPLRFLRELACVDRRLRPLDRPECSDFKPLQADGYSHHPYSLYDRPDARSPDPDNVMIGDLDRLSRLLDRLYRLGRITTRLPIFITEYGYETNPPDVVRGVSLRQQARYHGLATYLAWKQEDVSMFAQFQLNDVAPPPGSRGPVEKSRDWQTGLYFNDGRPKPLVQAFKLPFWAEADSVAGTDLVVLFGQVRPNTGRKRIEIEMRAPDGTWIPVQTYETRPAGDFNCGSDTTSFLTDDEGTYLRAASYQGPATYRARWIRTNGKSEYGIPIRVR
jgi:hypothetical protein